MYVLRLSSSGMPTGPGIGVRDIHAPTICV
jgi:hypothetical protein